MGIIRRKGALYLERVDDTDGEVLLKTKDFHVCKALKKGSFKKPLQERLNLRWYKSKIIFICFGSRDERK